MTPDILAIHQRQRARRTAQTPAEYADPFEVYRRPMRWRTRIAIAAVIVLFLAAAAAALKGMP
jgi:hypothetical protein